MTTAYTSLLGLALPVTGELSGTWGDTVNNAITSLLDTAVAGTTSITTDADITLTTTTGASNQARQAIILWNPASGTTTRNITAPAQSKVYTVINASGGTQSIVLRGVGPTTGVTIVKGESAVCAWNGSDFIKVSNTSGSGTFTNLTVTGNTILGDASADTVTVNGTITSNLIFTDNTYDIGASGATRPRNLYLAGNEVVAGSVTWSGGTANGVTYLNGSKVVTSGSALTFDGTSTLALSGASSGLFNIGPSGTGQCRIYSDSTGTFFGSVDSIPVIFRYGNTEQMRLNSTGLGIGTSSPAQKLHVLADTSGALFQGATLGGITFLKTGQTGMQLFSDATGTLKFYDNNAGATVLNLSSGNLGLGVTPSAWYTGGKAFQIFNGSGGSLNAYDGEFFISQNAYLNSDASNWVRNAAGYASQYHQVNGKHIWKTAASSTGNISFTQAMTLDASGNLGVGTTSPSGKLHVNNTGVGQLVIAYNGTSVNYYDADTQIFRNGAATERARIDSSGNLLVGLSSALTISGASSWQQQLAGTGATGYVAARFSNNANPARFITVKSRGASVGTNTIVQDGDELGSIDFAAADGTSYTSSARISGFVDGTPGTGDLPSRLTFSTTPDGASNPTERMRIDSSGNLLVGVNTATANGGVIQVSNGITFPATQSAASNANTLDDYEEGTWTPVLKFDANTQTLTVSNATYVKIGRSVSINMGISWGSKSGSGRVYITGLPFVKESGSTVGLLATCSAGTITTTSALFYNVDANQSILNLAQQSGDISSGSLANAGTLACTGTYFV